KPTEELQKDAVEKAIAAMKNRLESEEQSEIPEITADHPEAMVEEAMRSASVSEDMSPQIYAEVLKGAIAELMKTNKDRFPGASKGGGWVLDNYPLSADHWSALSEKGLLPDTVVCLKDTEKDGACILRRAYLASRNEGNSTVLGRPTDEALEKKEDDAREEMEETLTSEEDQSPAGAEEKEIMQPVFAEDGIPDTEEMKTITTKIDLFMNDWKEVESEIKNSSQVQVVLLEIAEQTPESLLNQIVLVMEKPFKYYGWELSDEDLEEEAQDLAAEEENEEEEEEGE
ncbi:KAD9 kinase, partial [Buphagus erythrorhynchus]|nr:KAD9 kinase [Buphagus erythrorhynchus]